MSSSLHYMNEVNKICFLMFKREITEITAEEWMKYLSYSISDNLKSQDSEYLLSINKSVQFEANVQFTR